jgi:hypothetical protein
MRRPVLEGSWHIAGQTMVDVGGSRSRGLSQTASKAEHFEPHQAQQWLVIAKSEHESL